MPQYIGHWMLNAGVAGGGGAVPFGLGLGLGRSIHTRLSWASEENRFASPPLSRPTSAGGRVGATLSEGRAQAGGGECIYRRTEQSTEGTQQ